MDNTINKFDQEVKNLENTFEALDMNNKASVKSFEAVVLELLAKLKRNQDKPENEDLEDDFEDLIYRVIIILGQLNLLEI